MAEFPALPLWTDAYLGDTTHLTTIQHGIYLLLLFAAWRSRDCALPDDDKMLARYCHLTTQQWHRHRPVIAPFWHIADGRWSNRRLSDELDTVRRLRNQRSTAGKASALKRLHRGSTGVQRNSNGEQAPTPTPTPKKESILSETSSDKRKPGVYPDDFNAFWKAYPTDSNMSKKLAHARWAKLSPEQRIAAMAAMPGFSRYCQQNKSWYRIVHAERFLSQERFEGYEPEQQMTPEEIEAQKDRTDRLLRRGKYDPQFGERRDDP